MKFDTFKVDFKSVIDGKHDVASPTESKNCEETDTCTHTLGSNSYMDVEDFFKGHQYEKKAGLVENEANIYADKIIRFSDNPLGSVKDVCINEVANYPDTLSVDGNEDQKDSSRLSDSELNGNGCMTNDMYGSTKEVTDGTIITPPISLELESSSENRHLHKVDSEESEFCSPASLLTSGDKLDSDSVIPIVGMSNEQVTDTLSVDGQKDSSRLSDLELNGNGCMTNDMYGSTKEVTDGTITPPISLDLESSSENRHLYQVDSEESELCSPASLRTSGDKLDSDSVVPIIGMSSEQMLDTDSSHVGYSSFNHALAQKQSNDHQKVDQGTSIERIFTKTTLDSREAKKDPNIGEVDNGVITLTFDNGASTLSGKREIKEETSHQQSEGAMHLPKIEGAVRENPSAASRSSFIQHGSGDSSFFEHVSLSGPIVSSGYIPYSGSISLRSDSSTTSARSFAFPVLQSEWNSSPVRMAKAERRNLRRNRGWRMGLLCCRF